MVKQSDEEKKKKKIGDDDEQPIRARIREVVEGKWITIVMSIITLFALFGDDFRLWWTWKSADPYFFAGLIISLTAFTTEILLQSCVIDDFKYSFFFWLDIVATISIVADIDWLVTIVETTLGLRPTVESADVFPGELAKQASQQDKLTKIIKSLRLIRLIRIIKLYKYLVKSNSEAEEARLREQQKLS